MNAADAILTSILTPTPDIVGESPVWDDLRQRLVWVDIVGKRINRMAVDGSDYESWETPGLPTCIGLCEDGRAIVGLGRSICLWNWDDSFVPFAEIEPDVPTNRLNEGAIGPDGAFWVGTMENNILADGSPKDISGRKGRLYRVLPSGEVNRASDDLFGVMNTLVWPTPDTLITADTTENKLFRYSVLESGRLANRENCLTGFVRGLPDGSCLDAKGSIFNCRVLGSCLIRLSANGHVDLVINLPVDMPTSCCFGGRDLDTMFVTSSRFGLSAEHVASTDDGKIVAVKGVGKGHLTYRFAPH